MSAIVEILYEGAKNCRLDVFLVNALAAEPEYAELTRSQVKLRIERGSVSVDGCTVTKAGHTLKPGSLVRVELPEPEPSHLKPFNFPLTILYEDEALLVIDKPANLSMHPGAGNPDRSVLNALIGHFKPGSAGFSDPARLGLVHRLDKDTTGVVVVAKTPAAMAMLSAQFSERSVKKVYQALAFVTPRGRRLVQLSAKGRIDAPLGRHPKRRTSMAVVAEGGRSAISDWECLELMPYAALLEVKLLTGRTHQIRVHLQHIGSPIIGDALYGEFSGLPKPLLEAAKAFGRQALHACCLEFNHPLTKERLMFESPLPMDFQELIKVFRGSDMHPFT